jgi:hypothetical protein
MMGRAELAYYHRVIIETNPSNKLRCATVRTMMRGIQPTDFLHLFFLLYLYCIFFFNFICIASIYLFKIAAYNTAHGAF